MKKLVIMPGGFHPFHAGHMALYTSAREAFPDADVYVAATNDTSERPFPFAIKEKLAKLAGVEAGHFVQVKSPFQAREITQNYDPETTALIFVRSEKDRTKPPQAGGTKKDGTLAYLQPITAELNPMNKNGYMAYLPTVEFGPGMTSATEIRTAWPTLNDKRKTALVMSLYPKTQSNPKLAQTVVKMLDTAIGSEQAVGEEQIDEGVNDPHIFKAIAMIGPMGAGKSTIARQLVGESGLRSLNLDNFNELLIKQGKVAGGNLTPAQLERSWQLTQQQKVNWVDGRLGLLIDGSGRNVEGLVTPLTQLEALGYNTMVILVNVSLETSLQRQQSRAAQQTAQFGTGRNVPLDFAKSSHEQIQQNIPKLKQLYGNRLLIINNEGAVDLSQEQNIISKFLNSPPSKPAAIQWIKSHGQVPGQQLDKRLAQQQRQVSSAQRASAYPQPTQQAVAESKSLTKKVKIVKGPDAGKTGWIREVKHGAFKGAPKTYYVDLDDGGQANNLPGTALRLVKDNGVMEGTSPKLSAAPIKIGSIYRMKVNGSQTYGKVASINDDRGTVQLRRLNKDGSPYEGTGPDKDSDGRWIQQSHFHVTTPDNLGKRFQMDNMYGELVPYGTAKIPGTEPIGEDKRPEETSPKLSVSKADVVSVQGVAEAAYPGNIGIMELAKFFDIATLEEKTRFKQLMNIDEKNKAWKLIQKVTGVKLQGKEFAEQRARPAAPALPVKPVNRAVAKGNINELSTDKLAQYKTAAALDAGAADKRGDYERGDKRFAGIVKATKKQFANDLKKHGQQGVAESQYEFAGKIPGPLSNGSTPTYYFKTLKGSEYILFSGGEVIRNKSEQGKGDTGLQPVSERCIFVSSPTFGLAVADFILNLTQYHRNIKMSNGIASLIISERKTPLSWKYAQYEMLGGSATGRVESRYSLVPTVGYFVVDFNKADNTGIHEAHPGHQVTEVARYLTKQGMAEISENIEISDDKSIVTISVDGKDRFMLQPAEGHKLKSYGGGTYKYWTIYDIERKKNRINSAKGMMSKNQAIAYVKKLVRLENKRQQAVKEGSLADAAKHVKKGALHKQEHIPLDKKIGATKLKSLKAHGTPLERKRANFALNIQGIKENAVQLSIQQLATISDAALDNAYHYGRSSPSNTFGWQANLKSAEFAKRMIDAGVTDIEKISDAIHKGWNVTAKAFVQNPEQFDDTEKLKAAGKLEAKLQQRAKLMNIEYAQLPNDEQEKDRVVAGALLQALKGETAVDEDAVTDLEHDMKPHSNYAAIDHLMTYLAAKHHITPEQLHDKFVDKHGMIPDEWIKHNPMSEADEVFDYAAHDQRMRRLKDKAAASKELAAQGKKPVTRLNPKTGKYYVDFKPGPDYVDEDPFRG